MENTIDAGGKNGLPIRLIVLDMDGTLLDDKKRIKKSSIDALHIASKKGVICALDTGRAISELNQYRDELRDVRYWICESGAIIYDSKKDEIMKRNTIAPDAGIAVLDTLETLSQDVLIQVMRGGIVEVNAAQVPIMARYYMAAYMPLFRDTATKVENIVHAVRQDPNNIEKINIYHTDKNAREVTKNALAAMPLEKAYAETTALELSAIGVNKGAALLELCHILGVDAAQSAAVGDSDNDVTMLLAAAYPIVMGNAQEHIKRLARLVVSDNNNDGAAEAILAVL